MENVTMSREELIAVFGEETAALMLAQMESNTGGKGAPFSFVKKIADMDSELGKWGEHVVNVQSEKNDAGERIITDKGINLGVSFDIFVIDTAYQYSRWDDVKERTETSNVFTDVTTGMASAVNLANGEPLPKSKEDKKAAGWKMRKIMGVLVRSDAKSPWIPAIYEISGKTYYTFGVLTDNKPSKGLMDGIYTLKFKKEKKGSTTYTVIDTDASVFTPRPADFFSNPETRDMISDVAKKMAAWRESLQAPDSTKQATPVGSGTQEEPDDDLAW